MSTSERDREDRQVLEADERRALDQYRESQVLQVRQEHERLAGERDTSERERDRSRRRSRRHAAYALFSASAAFGAAAAIVSELGTKQYDLVKKGGLGTVMEINNAADLGSTYKNVGLGCLGAAGISLSIAVPLLLLNLDPGKIEISAIATRFERGVSIGGHF